MNCKKHPKYQAKRRPMSDCPTCKRMWDEKQGIKALADVYKKL